ncbi:response regulator [Paenibacillus flagellatus]|uniref:DNA-binding response regulator n=1 Tax=Paenibacillus flagellatus TaxID=2211139 RepID=A0A2V5KL93_9BACL|nr:response regulator [Paenibacillus flagellatus]PYI55730.1 DNA-binding response regulator [Paenibacillus flagellatus]
MFQLLIVDDEAGVVDSLADTLPWADIGITAVFKAYSAPEALDIMRMNSIDILMTDIRMPGMNGLELLAHVRRDWKRMKCILLSGHAEFAYAQQAIRHEAHEYLLKPISDEDVLAKVAGLVDALRRETDERMTYQRVVKAFQEHLPKLRGELLGDLLQGTVVSPQRLAQKLESLKVEIKEGERFALMLVRLEERFAELDFYSLSLMEYAVANMAEELFEDEFRLWSCKDIHGYLAFLVTAADGRSDDDGGAETDRGGESTESRIRFLASQLQLNVNRYLKGSVSVLIGRWGTFPQDVKPLYEDCLLSLRRSIGNQSGLLVYVSEETERMPVHSLQRLYEPPLLVHLLESGDWERTQDKLEGIWDELNEKWAESQEHVMELFFSVYASYSSFAHKNGRQLADMIGPLLADVTGLTPCRSAASLRQWMFQSFALLQQCMENETRNDRESAVRRIQSFVQQHLVEDVSLQAIADHMYMHPVHVSRIYKLETGENISDYVLRLKMELAASLLADPSLKNYEVSLKLGYQNPNYFIKVFKKYYSVTPQEYRLKLESGS